MLSWTALGIVVAGPHGDLRHVIVAITADDRQLLGERVHDASGLGIALVEATEGDAGKRCLAVVGVGVAGNVHERQKREDRIVLGKNLDDARRERRRVELGPFGDRKHVGVPYLR